MSKAYQRGRNDGRSGKSENPYHPDSSSRDSYREGNDRGSSEKSESESND